jgi:methylated-DNA-protein-cysteine methyltransferase-like protein
MPKGNTTPHSSRIAGLGAPPQSGGESNKRNFFEDVFEVVRLIPRGRVTNYGSIAKYLGSGLSSRMVGWAMNASHFSTLPVPAHRVVNRAGMLTGRHHFETPEKMQQLLEEEGHIIKDNCIQQFNNVFWDPQKELNL